MCTYAVCLLGGHSSCHHPVMGTVNVHVYVHLTHCVDCTPVVQTGHPDQGTPSLTSQEVQCGLRNQHSACQGRHGLRAKLQGMEPRTSTRRKQSRGKPEKTRCLHLMPCPLTVPPKPVSSANFKANTSFADLIFLLNFLVVVPQFYLV